MEPTNQIMTFRTFIATFVYLPVSFGMLDLYAQSKDAVDFTQSIKPILADNCFACHGPDQQKAGLRLDDADAATILLKSGERAIVPHQSDASALVERIFTNDPDEDHASTRKRGPINQP
jgi:mono/diheme cytochrome c family protein